MLSLIILALLALVWLFAPFWEALFLAAILATATYRGYERLLARLQRAEVAALVMTLLMLFAVVLPLAYLLVKVSVQAGSFYGQAQSWLAGGEPRTLLSQLMQWLPLDEETQQMLLAQLRDKAGMLLGWVQTAVVGTIKVLLGSTAHFFTFIALAMFALFFFYRDGQAIARHVMVLSPLENSLDRLMIDRFTSLSTVLALSVVGVALLQGLSFALLAWLLGLPGLFIGVGVAVASFIPVVGAALVWLPLAVWLATQGQLLSAAVIAVWGAAGAGFLIDNIARPWLIVQISRHLPQTQALAVSSHTFLTVLSTLAGLIHFGVLGLFFGPVIAAMAITVFEVYEAKHGERLDRH
ncbi:Predicted PurR-regulated permease PerM [Sulfurivirga caldicuralii]|uniref:Predicted PurR-regulated permease PerM n=1 Tax=Sulfurivirga caldicuralii TaxID=364032 RepID=A0A1N6DMZ7_9GAMM|nr:Predicted PurR-regulated permease PerM [Sulfurivirga caldicuralii]